MNEKDTTEFLNSAMINGYLDILRSQQMSKNTIINYNSVLKRFNEFLIEDDIKLHDLKLADMYRYLETLSTYAAHSKNLHIACIQGIFTYMVEIGARTDIPIVKHMRAKIIRYEPDYIDRTTQLVYLNYLQKHTQRDQLIGAELMLATGLRISEIMSIDLVKDIEFRDDKAYLKVRKSKGRRGRICPVFNAELTPKLRQLIAMYFPIGSYKLNIIKSSYLYVNDLFYEKTGIRITPHILRYTFATERAAEGLNIDIIRRLLGHKFYTTTLMYIVENQQQIYNLI